MQHTVASGRFHTLKSLLKILLCVVLVVSLCPPMTGAFAIESGEADTASSSSNASADSQGSVNADDAGAGIASDGNAAGNAGEDAIPAVQDPEVISGTGNEVEPMPGDSSEDANASKASEGESADDADSQAGDADVSGADNQDAASESETETDAQDAEDAENSDGVDGEAAPIELVYNDKKLRAP